MTADTEKHSPHSHVHADGQVCDHDHSHDHHHHGQASPTGTFARTTPKIGRNDPCPCGSGKKHKKCCLTAAA
jgi:uncharacterized protein YecA (UPF0149 family)